MSEINNSSTILNMVTSLQQERMELVKRVEELRTQNEGLKISMSVSSVGGDQTGLIESLKEQIGVLKKENEELKESGETAVSENKEIYEKQISQKQEKIEELLDTIKGLETRVTEIQTECNKYKEQKSVPDPHIEELERLAYTDIKTGTLNNNALNQRLASLDLKHSVFAIFSISGTKHINDEFGKKAGDQFIKKVADQLLLGFGQNVYRIMGDQFVIVLDESEKSYNDTYSILTETQQALAKIEVRTTFGVARGSEHASVRLMTEAVENQLKAFKGTKVTEDVKQWSEAPKQVVKEEKKPANEVSEDELIAGFLG